jgi:hypothetical protein
MIDAYQTMIDDLRAYSAALDIIVRLSEGWMTRQDADGGTWWFRPQCEPERMSEREWQVYREAARRATGL